jgi:hypothetical protein
LIVDWRCGFRRRGTLTVPLRTTGQATFRRFEPGGEVVTAPGYVTGGH